MRQSAREVFKKNFLCFICYVKTSKDSQSYAEGGLGRCSEDRAFNKLKEEMVLCNMPGHKFEAAAKRLNLLLSGPSYDVFAVDVYYHRHCYLAFACPYRAKETQDTDEAVQVRIRGEFLELIDRKIVQDEEAYLLTDLLEDIACLSDENGLPEPFIK